MPEYKILKSLTYLKTSTLNKFKFLIVFKKIPPMIHIAGDHLYQNNNNHSSSAIIQMKSGSMKKKRRIDV